MRVLVVEDAAAAARDPDPEPAGGGLPASTATPSGEEAVRLAATVPYDAIVLDVRLPDVDGFEVCRQVRAAGSWSPILMLTARDAVDDRVRGLDVGADDYLTKPFEFPELFARVRALVRRDAHAAAGDARRRRARARPGHAHRAERTASRSTSRRRSSRCSSTSCATPARRCRASRLIEHVWDYTYRATRTSSTSTSAACARRSTARSSEASLETVRGVGYRLSEEPPAAASSLRVRLTLAFAAGMAVVLAGVAVVRLRQPAQPTCGRRSTPGCSRARRSSPPTPRSADPSLGGGRRRP